MCKQEQCWGCSEGIEVPLLREEGTHEVRMQEIEGRPGRRGWEMKKEWKFDCKGYCGLGWLLGYPKQSSLLDRIQSLSLNLVLSHMRANKKWFVCFNRSPIVKRVITCLSGS